MSDAHTNQIEETLAHQEQQINDLSDMVIAQGRAIDTLQKQLRKLQDKISAGVEGDNGDEKPLSATQHAALNKPPHY